MNTEELMTLIAKELGQTYCVTKNGNTLTIIPSAPRHSDPSYGVKWNLDQWMGEFLYKKGIEWNGGCYFTAYYENQKSNYICKQTIEFTEENIGIKHRGAYTLRGARMPWSK